MEDYNQKYGSFTQYLSDSELIITLYEGLIKLIYQAKTAQDAGDIARRFDCLDRAIALCRGLSENLNKDADINIYKALFKFYDDLADNLVELNMGKSYHLYEDCVEKVKRVLNAWKEGFKQIESQPQTKAKPISEENFTFESLA
jgi:flagellar biosynthetic protein FliS